MRKSQKNQMKPEDNPFSFGHKHDDRQREGTDSLFLKYKSDSKYCVNNLNFITLRGGRIYNLVEKQECKQKKKKIKQAIQETYSQSINEQRLGPSPNIMEKQIMGIMANKIDKIESKGIICQCVSFKCLEKNCQCFRDGKSCGDDCGCFNCENNKGHYQIGQQFQKSLFGSNHRGKKIDHEGELKALSGNKRIRKRNRKINKKLKKKRIRRAKQFDDSMEEEQIQIFEIEFMDQSESHSPSMGSLY